MSRYLILSSMSRYLKVHAKIYIQIPDKTPVVCSYFMKFKVCGKTSVYSPSTSHNSHVFEYFCAYFTLLPAYIHNKEA